MVFKFVYFRTEHYSGEEKQEQNCWKLWIPCRLRKDVIRRSSCDPIASHGGMVKTLELLRRCFFWPGMVKDVREYVKNCETCKVTKAPNFLLRPEMGKQMVSTRPFQKLYVDIIGPYPRSRSGYTGLLIVLDHLTKFHWLFPLRKFTSKAIEDYLKQQIFRCSRVYCKRQFSIQSQRFQCFFDQLWCATYIYGRLLPTEQRL